MREARRLKLRVKRRRWRVRKKVSGTAARPRLTVYRSGRHIYCQLVDDEAGKTLGFASTLSPEIREEVKACSWNRKGAERVGELIALRAKECGVTKVSFDRNGYRFHGRVKALAEGARKNGLSF
jgi:large subunit ribosomal protein L18